MLITVFTPTYNRAYTLPKLYCSLLKQTDNDFEWLVVDDGSTDNTKEIITDWVKSRELPIRYFFQENGGKHRAINRAVKEAHGELFFIVDSDDYLEANAIERIKWHYSLISENLKFAGVCCSRYYPNGERIGGKDNFGVIECNQFFLRFKLGIKGDMNEAIRTDVMKEFPFPEIDGEKFCTEAYVYNKIAQKYFIRYFDEMIYICDYLPDGLTAKIVKVRMESPITSMLYYSDLINYDVPFFQKIKAMVNYWRFAFCLNHFTTYLVKNPNFYIFLPVGFIFHLKDIWRCR